jgi:hypothetical protein
LRQVFETDGAGSVERLKRSTRELLGYRRRSDNIEDILLQALAFGVTDGRLPD